MTEIVMPDLAPIMPVFVEIQVKTDAFRFLWLKRVTDFDPAVHCAKCLKGSYVKGLPFRGTGAGFALETLVDMEGAPYLYLCGVAGRWADNLHMALVPEARAEVSLEDDRLAVRFVGARQIAIPELPPEVSARLTAPFHTCRNYRFGWEYLYDPDGA